MAEQGRSVVLKCSHIDAQGLTVGTRVWGAVTEATARQLTISLPHGLRGKVSAPEV